MGVCVYVCVLGVWVGVVCVGVYNIVTDISVTSSVIYFICLLPVNLINM